MCLNVIRLILEIYLIYSFGNNFALCKTSSKAGSFCTIKGSRSLIGNCKPIIQCPETISNLRSGIRPTLCSIDAGRKPLICCPVEPRISELMCDGYKEILRRSSNFPTPLLPLFFLQNRPKGINCLTFFNKLIVGGRAAQQDELPFMASLGWGKNQSNLSFRCGGTLISENFILTAAHCVSSPEGPPTYALLGDVKLLSEFGETNSLGRTIARISEAFIHPHYKRPSSYNDIALLKLKEKLRLSRSVLPACLPNGKLRLELRKNVSASGWGRTGTLKGQSTILQTVDLIRFSQNDCSEFYNHLTESKIKFSQGISKTHQFCAGDADYKNSEKDTCHGDSGGPLIVPDEKHKCVSYVVGITSFGPQACGYIPGVYTNVQSYLDFIENIVWPDE